MKATIESIYDDNQTLFTNNNFINSDDRLADITELNNDLDLIVEMTYGAREIFKRYLVEDDDEVYKYNLTKIHKSIYATLLENRVKYITMLQSDDVLEDTNPLHQFYEKDIIGERVRENDIASRVDTNAHGTVNKTNTYGDITESNTHGTINSTTTHGNVNVQNTVGQAVNSTQMGARETTDAVTSFSSATFENTDKSIQAQTTDTQTLGMHTDTSQTTQGNDTEQITQGNDGTTTTHGNDTEQITQANDTITYGAHKDVITDTESIDEKMGYNDLTTQLEKRRNYTSRNTLKEIVNDVINGITYGVYLF